MTIKFILLLSVNCLASSSTIILVCRKDEVIPCQIGYFSTSNSSKCTKCAAGQKCPNTDGTDIEDCPGGTYSLSGQTDCTNCPAG